MLARREGSLILVLLFLTGCSFSSYVFINDIKIKIEIADNDLGRAKGLMFRESLCENCGMLFIFDENSEKNFWMKNTLIPLDIIFIDEKFLITKIEKAEPCKKGECGIYSGTGKYVLEVNQGFSEKNKFKINDSVRIDL